MPFSLLLVAPNCWTSAIPPVLVLKGCCMLFPCKYLPPFVDKNYVFLHWKNKKFVMWLAWHLLRCGMIFVRSNFNGYEWSEMSCRFLSCSCVEVLNTRFPHLQLYLQSYVIEQLKVTGRNKWNGKEIIFF